MPTSLTAIFNPMYLGPLLFLLAVASSAFLFWRAGRYEYIAPELLFYIFSRIFDFVFNFSAYEWSFARLVFFNAYPGFDVWGALFGAVFALYFFVRKKKSNFWLILDLLAAPAVFGLFVYSLSHLASGVFDALFYFVIFLVLKRLEIKKRHKGFFACLGAVSVSAVNLIFYWPIVFYDYRLLRPAAILISGLVFWYILAKGNIRRDIKGIFGWLLLLALGLRRVFTSLADADKLAKNIILSPYYFGRTVVFFVRLIGREIFLAVSGFAHTLGLKR